MSPSERAINMDAQGPGARMDDRELEALRRHGFGAAYRMLGSVSEAEDPAREAMLRLTRQEGRIEEPAAWITTVVTRLSINVLKSARTRRESYVGPWLPEPLVEDPALGPASRSGRRTSCARCSATSTRRSPASSSRAK
jgi:DNA-directed RNA polymerase specialized sigma24 family protein